MSTRQAQVELLRRLIGNPNAYALQQEDGSYWPVRRPLSERELYGHLKGHHTVGTYVNRGDQARTLVVDLDENDVDKLNAIHRALTELGVGEPYIGEEYSGRKGFHVWVVLQEYVPARDLRLLGRAALALAGVQCEVFPKQDDVRDLGNLVKLPLGVHRVTGKRSEWWGRPPRPMPRKSWEALLAQLGSIPGVQARTAGSRNSRFPCMEHIQSGVQEGGRNIALFHLATLLRRHGLVDETVELVLGHVNQKCEPPLDEDELGRVVETSRHSGPICEQLPAALRCGVDCIKERVQGLALRAGQLRHASEGENVVVTLVSRRGPVVRFAHDDLDSAKGVLR